MQTSKMPLVSIILLNYKGSQDTIDCLQSLHEIIYPNYRVVVVDNASPDDSMERLSDHLQLIAPDKWNRFDYPDEAMHNPAEQRKYTLLQTGHNGGYGHGNNVGIKYAMKNAADYVLVLNNDTVVDPEFLEPMVQMCEEDKNIGIASGQIFYLDSPDTFWFNGGTFDKCTGKVVHIDYGKKNIGQKPLGSSTFISGCMWLIPKEIFEDVGYINEDYFMYVEDLEFCQRVLKKGYVLRVSAHSHIYHRVGSSSGGEITEFSMYWMTRNILKYMFKNIHVFCYPIFFYNSILKFFMQWLFQGKFYLIKAQFKALNHVLFGKGSL